VACAKIDAEIPEIEMQLLDYVGTFAAICTTGAFIPQIVKIRQRGGQDVSYSMLLIYLVGILLWLMYGLLLHAPEIIWANGATAFLVIVAAVMKMTHPSRIRQEKID
jgi:MtN3 and saliva related transmembrane protein